MITIRQEGMLISLIGEAPSNPLDGNRYINGLKQISAHRRPFVLLVDLSVDIQLTQDQRKAQNLWYKTDRERIQANCRAMALVRPLADGDMQRLWQSLFSFPVLVTRSHAEAQSFLSTHQESQATDGIAN